MNPDAATADAVVLIAAIVTRLAIVGKADDGLSHAAIEEVFCCA
jgi:hypothetical protein